MILISIPQWWAVAKAHATLILIAVGDVSSVTATTYTTEINIRVKAIGALIIVIGDESFGHLTHAHRDRGVTLTVAIAIVAETCSPFTVLPALMNEYRVPELNVQNGVLKALSFMFEYIGEMGKDYIYAVTPLLADALAVRRLPHLQLGDLRTLYELVHRGNGHVGAARHAPRRLARVGAELGGK